MEVVDPAHEALYSRGCQVREDVLGSTGASERTDELRDAFRDVSNTLAWGGIWSREGLGTRDRCLLTVALLAAQGITEPLPMHIRGALRNGVTKAELREALLHVGLYAGFPRASVAVNVASDVLEETH